jgi:peptide deformylase
LTWPNALLEKHIETSFSAQQSPDYFKRLGDDLADTMEHYNAVGLAAPQVGEMTRMFVMMDSVAGALFFINPTWRPLTAVRPVLNEGCVSFPGIVEKRLRYVRVAVDSEVFMDGKWQLITRNFDGLQAQCVQHEVEHLNGITFAFSKGPLGRKLLREKLAKLKKAAKR